MGKHGKRYAESAKLMDPKALYSPADAVRLLKQMGRAKFDETVEVAIRLGIDSKQADQQIRGTVALPAGARKTGRGLGFAKGGKAKEAESAWADYVGAEGHVEKNQGGGVEFDVAVGTPDPVNVVG